MERFKLTKYILVNQENRIYAGHWNTREFNTIDEIANRGKNIIQFRSVKAAETYLTDRRFEKEIKQGVTRYVSKWWNPNTTTIITIKKLTSILTISDVE